MWRGQFWLSFGSNCGLAVLFFLGALVGQDHTPGRQAGSMRLTSPTPQTHIHHSTGLGLVETG